MTKPQTPTERFEQEVMERRRRRPQAGASLAQFAALQLLGTIVFLYVIFVSQYWMNATDLLVIWFAVGMVGAIADGFRYGDAHQMSLTCFGTLAIALALQVPIASVLGLAIAFVWGCQRLSLSSVLLGHLSQLIGLIGLMQMLGGSNVVG